MKFHDMVLFLIGYLNISLILIGEIMSEQDVSESNEVTQTSLRSPSFTRGNCSSGVKSWNCPIEMQMKAGVVRLVAA